MTKNSSKKQFDCITMKNNIQKQVYEETKDMTANELLHYFNGSSKSTKTYSRRPTEIPGRVSGTIKMTNGG